MSNIIETSFGTRIDPKRVAAGAVSVVKKQGAFFVFSVRLSSNDIREYSFTNRERSKTMRQVFIEHLEQKLKLETRSSAVV